VGETDDEEPEVPPVVEGDDRVLVPTFVLGKKENPTSEHHREKREKGALKEDVSEEPCEVVGTLEATVKGRVRQRLKRHREGLYVYDEDAEESEPTECVETYVSLRRWCGGRRLRFGVFCHLFPHVLLA